MALPLFILHRTVITIHKQLLDFEVTWLHKHLNYLDVLFYAVITHIYCI